MALIPLREILKGVFKSLRKGFIHTPRFSRRASRAGLLHFPTFQLLFDHKYPKFPRRASRAGLLKEILKGILTGLLRHSIRK